MQDTKEGTLASSQPVEGTVSLTEQVAALSVTESATRSHGPLQDSKERTTSTEMVSELQNKAEASEPTSPRSCAAGRLDPLVVEDESAARSWDPR